MKADTFNLFHNVLDSQRAEVFNKLGDGFENWYLAGGTALALQIGHRISFDFDLFSQHKIDPAFTSSDNQSIRRQYSLFNGYK